MKAAVMDGVRQPLVVRTVPDPEPPPAGAVIRVEANGVCRSDGHERGTLGVTVIDRYWA